MANLCEHLEYARSNRVKLPRLALVLGQQARSLVGRTTAGEIVTEAARDPLIESTPIIASTIYHHHMMGLPQELIGQIMDMLHDDPRALKACSLTCKAMFASTRYLIHRTLRLTQRNNQSVLTHDEKYRYLGWDRHNLELRFLSYMGERGFLRFTRHVHIRMGQIFTPDLLMPHLNHFQSLDRVHSLNIENYDATVWRGHYKTFFVHFYPTLTSLTLHRPLNHYRYVMQFALQFPKLENLCIEHLGYEWTQPDLIIPPVVNKSPPLRGRLRLVGVGPGDWPAEFTHLPNGINFRSVELQDVVWHQAQRMLIGCADTLEDLTIVFCKNGKPELGYLSLKKNPVLRQLTFRVAFPWVPALLLDSTLSALSTITSLVFCEFILELGKLPSQFSLPSSEHWGDWSEVDRLFENKFADRGHSRVVIRTGKLYDRETFQVHARESFPLLARRGCIRFETSHSIDQFWR